MLSFRPHHFMCTLGFEGKGYSDAFVRNYQKIADLLRAPDGSGDSTKIRVSPQTDSVCDPCPNRNGTACVTEEKIRRLDDAHAQILNLKPGDVVTWREAKHRIARQMTVEKFHEACAPCAWKSLGVCEAALNRLIESESSYHEEKD